MNDRERELIKAKPMERKCMFCLNQDDNVFHYIPYNENFTIVCCDNCFPALKEYKLDKEVRELAKQKTAN